MALRVFSTNSKFAVLKELKNSAGPSRVKIVALFDTEAEADEYYDSLSKPDDYYVESIKDIKQHNPDIVNLKVGTELKSSHKRLPFRLFSDNKISSDEDFRDYAHNVMKQAHKDNYSKETTDKVVDDLLKNNPDADYGELVGRLTSGFGDREFSSTYIGHYEVQDEDGSWVPKTMTIKVEPGKNPQSVFEEKLNNLKKKGKRISSPKLTYGSY